MTMPARKPDSLPGTFKQFAARFPELADAHQRLAAGERQEVAP